MATNEHLVVKPQKIAATAAAALEQQLVLPALFQREGIDQYKGTVNDTINVKVEGVLPFHTYEWRSGSTGSTTPGTRASINFDQYAERTISVSFGGNVYSAVRLTDEQNEFDLPGWAKLVSKQTEAIGRGLEFEAADYLINAPYAVNLAGAKSGRNLRDTLIRARAVLNSFRVPSEGRSLIVGTGWEAALLADTTLNFASNVGEQEAVSALREASIGRRFGFDIVVSQELPSDMAVAMVRSAFIFATGAPSVPQSVPFGATASANGVAVRWLRDYDSERFQDRSVVNTYRGFRNVKDILMGRTAGTDNAFVSTHEHFVRAIKLDLDATSDVLPTGAAAGDAADELARITGVGTPFSG